VTRKELLALPATVDVPTAGRFYGLGREASYGHARAGTFPVRVLRLGRLLRVRTADLIADLAPDMRDGAAPPAALGLLQPAAHEGAESRAR
jgi:hypothetical protein